MEDPAAVLRDLAGSMPPRGGETDAQGIVEIVGPDLEKMLSFYTALGFEVERRTGPFAVTRGFGIRLFLAENADAPVDGRWANVRVVVPDVDLVWDCIKAIGLPTANLIGDRPYGLRDFLVSDPVGFEIRFAQILPRHDG